MAPHKGGRRTSRWGRNGSVPALSVNPALGRIRVSLKPRCTAGASAAVFVVSGERYGTVPTEHFTTPSSRSRLHCGRDTISSSILTLPCRGRNNQRPTGKFFPEASTGTDDNPKDDGFSAVTPRDAAGPLRSRVRRGPVTVVRNDRKRKEPLMLGSKLHMGGALAIGAFLALPGAAFAQQAPAKQVTFSKDVAPIFQSKCQSCHEPGSIGPMSLVTYQDARPWARSIKNRVEARQMPPWHIDRSVGVQKFKNDMSLTDEQVATVVAGSTAAPSRATRPTSRPKPVAKELFWAGERDGYGPPGPRHQVARLHDACRPPGRVVAPGQRHPGHRTALGADGRDSSDQPGGPQDPASLDRVPRPEPRERRRRQHRHRWRPSGGSRPADCGAGRRPTSSTVVRS